MNLLLAEFATIPKQTLTKSFSTCSRRSCHSFKQPRRFVVKHRPRRAHWQKCHRSACAASRCFKHSDGVFDLYEAAGRDTIAKTIKSACARSLPEELNHRAAQVDGHLPIEQRSSSSPSKPQTLRKLSTEASANMSWLIAETARPNRLLKNSLLHPHVRSLRYSLALKTSIEVSLAPAFSFGYAHMKPKSSPGNSGSNRFIPGIVILTLCLPESFCNPSFQVILRFLFHLILHY